MRCATNERRTSQPRAVPDRPILAALFALGWASALVAQAPAAGSPAAGSPAAEKVIARCVEALGGEDAWRAIDTLELEGQHTSFSQTRPFLLQRKRPNLYRFDHGQAGFQVLVAYDGETAWWRTEAPLISRATWPVETPTPYTRAIRLDAEFEMPFVSYREKGHRIRLVGESELDGEQVLELEIARGNNLVAGSVERWFLDSATYLPLLRVSEGTYHGYDTEQRTRYLGYRRVAGVLIPHRVETEVGNDFTELEVERVRLNAKIEEAVFDRPLPAGMEKLRMLAGRWRVTIESRDDPAFNPQRPVAWEEHQTVSLIHSRFGGSLLDEEIAVNTERPRRVRRIYSYDRFRQLFRIARIDTFTLHLDVLEGRLTDGRLVTSDLGTETPPVILGQPVYNREILDEIQPDSFRLERQVSSDGGNTWRSEIKFSYRRMAEEDPSGGAEP